VVRWVHLIPLGPGLDMERHSLPVTSALGAVDWYYKKIVLVAKLAVRPAVDG